MLPSLNTWNTSSSVPNPPGKAMKRSLSRSITSLRSPRLCTWIVSSSSDDTIPRSTNLSGTTPVTLAPVSLAARATQSISPKLAPPYTRRQPWVPIQRPSLAVCSKYSGAISVAAEQNTATERGCFAFMVRRYEKKPYLCSKLRRY